MLLLVLIVIGFACIVSPVFRCLFLWLFKYIYDRLRDIYIYIRYKKYNIAEQRNMIIFVANPKKIFGSGKTLMMVKYFYRYYKKYNNKIIYVKNEEGKYVKKIQKLICFSNLEIKGIPIVWFDSLEMIEEWKDKKAQLEEENPDCVYKLIILSDELGAVLNSRSFKSNITNSNINAILQQRHLDVCMWVSSSQKFNYVDALYRNSIDKCITCRLIGLLDYKYRLLYTEVYIAQDFENITDPEKLKPLKRKCFYILNSDYNRYDTKHMITDLIHKQKSGDLISDEEYLKAIQLENTSINVKVNTKKKKGLLKR